MPQDHQSEALLLEGCISGVRANVVARSCPAMAANTNGYIEKSAANVHNDWLGCRFAGEGRIRCVRRCSRMHR
jgi:hypothetical protein